MSLVNNGALQNPAKITAATQSRNGSTKTETSFYNQFSEELNLY